MDLKEKTVEELMERRAAIVAELDAPEADLDALEEETRAINAELEARKAEETRKAELRAQVAQGAGVTVKEFPNEERKEMTLEEIRSSKEYVEAFAKYIKTEDDSECRALLTTNATGGQVPVPTIIEGRVRTAWERNGLMALVRKTYIRGNVQVGFELSATGAVVHTEGAAAPAEETLTFGVVSLIPQSIKKWIRISDEAVDMGGEEFLNYIYDEVTYQIAKEAARILITLITGAPAASTATAVGVPAIEGEPDLGVVALAYANLSDEAETVTCVMNKLTHAAFIEKIAKNGYKFDPFEDFNVVYNNTLPAYSAATSGQTWMIVGDFGLGAQANFPNGDEIKLKYDDLSEAQADLVKIVGREFVALAVVTPGAFVKVTKA